MLAAFIEGADVGLLAGRTVGRIDGRLVVWSVGHFWTIGWIYKKKSHSWRMMKYLDSLYEGLP